MLLIVGRQYPRRIKILREDRRAADIWRLGRGWHGLGAWIADGACYRILDLDSIMFQSAARSTIKFHFRFFVNRHGRDQVEFSNREVALRTHGLVARPRPERLLFLHDFEGALRQVSRLAGCIDARSSLL